MSLAIPEALQHTRPRRMRRAEYDRLVDLGFFRDERVELIRGLVVEMAPIGAPHSDPIDFLSERFVLLLAGRARVRIQLPFALSNDSEPEPDLALVPPGRYNKQHPSQAFLIVEVAHSSLDYDRLTKGPLYAEAGVPEYWIVNVSGRCVEVYDQTRDRAYQRIRSFERGTQIAPAAFSDACIDVGELFIE
jgi:Uma2 family endonuclease